MGRESVRRARYRGGDLAGVGKLERGGGLVVRGRVFMDRGHSR